MGTPATPTNPWPFAIGATLGLFGLGLAGLIVLANHHPSDLVAKDYYEEELHYQQHLDRVQRNRSLAAPAQVLADTNHGAIRITLPEGHLRPDLAGRIHLYRPSAASLDRHLQLEVDSKGMQTLGTQEMAPGLWKVRIEWTVGHQDYYTDQSVIVPPRG